MIFIIFEFSQIAKQQSNKSNMYFVFCINSIIHILHFWKCCIYYIYTYRGTVVSWCRGVQIHDGTETPSNFHPPQLAKRITARRAPHAWGSAVSTRHGVFNPLRARWRPGRVYASKRPTRVRDLHV